uniref:Uncharacterized protein n=1 Tax=Timema poppense TaxID=170557 RepID=A0A7R9CKZ1_TIMPO|nr:unnamed protein product [Timema poppensis]
MPPSPVSGRNSVDSMDQEERSPSASSGPKKTSPPEQPTEEQQQPQPEYGEHGHEEEHSKSGHTLVNKQMVLPFIPPKFPNQTTNSDSLIKPSEYLRSLSHIKPPSQPPQPPSSVTVATSNGVINGTLQRPTERETTPISDEQTSVAGKTPPREDASLAQGPPPAPPAAGPPPPPLPVTDPKEDDPFSTATRKLQQPLGTISIQELNSVQLRRTDKMMAAKTLSAPARPAVNGEPFLTQKDDLIAELKMSKDISGIKKLKVERAKVEERQEKEMFTEITKQLNANTFVEKIPDKDATGNPIPPWKRQMLAKKAAERAKKELEEQLLKEAEEKRLQSIPPWKRQLLAKKEEIDTRKPVIYTPRVIDDKKPTKGNKGEESLKPPHIVDPSPSPPPTENEEDDNNNSVYNKENKTPPSEESAEGPAQIIPWRAQLRKTNSKLSLLE